MCTITVNVTIPTEADAVPVMSVFGWLIIHQRLDVSSSWNLPWADYKAGFGSTDGDFWLGLEKMHLLTSSQPYRLRVEVQKSPTNFWQLLAWSSENLVHLVTSSQRYHLRVEVRQGSTNFWKLVTWSSESSVHLLTSFRSYRLRVEVQQVYTELWFSAEYWSFKIGDELNDKYRLEVEGYSGDAGDALQHEGDQLHDGMMFSTYDQDNDRNPTRSCVWTRSGGWWFNYCEFACLTCHSSRYEWETLPGSIFIVNSRMMIKPQ